MKSQNQINAAFNSAEDFTSLEKNLPRLRKIPNKHSFFSPTFSVQFLLITINLGRQIKDEVFFSLALSNNYYLNETRRLKSANSSGFTDYNCKFVDTRHS